MRQRHRELCRPLLQSQLPGGTNLHARHVLRLLEQFSAGVRGRSGLYQPTVRGGQVRRSALQQQRVLLGWQMRRPDLRRLRTAREMHRGPMHARQLRHGHVRPDGRLLRSRVRRVQAQSVRGQDVSLLRPGYRAMHAGSLREHRLSERWLLVVPGDADRANRTVSSAAAVDTSKRSRATAEAVALVGSPMMGGLCRRRSRL